MRKTNCKYRKSEDSNRKKQKEYMNIEELKNVVDNSLLKTRDSLLFNRSSENYEESSDLNEDLIAGLAEITLPIMVSKMKLYRTLMLRIKVNNNLVFYFSGL